jgi:hypothetical protein
MILLRTWAFLALLLFFVGILVGTLVRKVPRRGWVAILLLMFSALLWAFSEPSDTAYERAWLLPCFTFTASVAVIYSFRIRRGAPDRKLVTAALVGACIIAIFLIFMLCGAAYTFYLTFSTTG